MLASQNMKPGYAAGQRAKGDGVTSFLCVNHAIQQPSWWVSAAEVSPMVSASSLANPDD